MNALFSIIIPALNEEHFIGKLLQALKSQTFQDFEVIVVDAQSNDRTVKVVKKFQNDFPLKIISTNLRNISGSRNVGANSAKGEYLFFIDSDNSVFPSFLAEVRKIIESKKSEMIIPSVVPDSQKAVYKIIYSAVNGLVAVSKSLNIAFSTGGNLIIKRDKFEALEGFSEKIFVGEDHDIVKQAIKKKLKITFMSHPKIIFSVRRLEKEKFSLILKYFISTMYIVLFGKLTRKIYNYPMGGQYFDKKK